MFTCINVRTNLYIHIYVYICIYRNIHIYIYTCIHILTYKHTETANHIGSRNQHYHPRVFTCIDVYTSLYIHMYMYTHVYIDIYNHIYIYTCIHTYIHKHRNHIPCRLSKPASQPLYSRRSTLTRVSSFSSTTWSPTASVHLFQKSTCH